ncbi:Uncharacterised protein [Citrobacter koseri]|uniref:Uncharacterized protein n=1 Tax=Citrobacter koseri TaxID=545 RepID=A0A2X2VQ99_CITKO|nr:Uncharacterised protein [Citrobacter koseri]
MDNRSAPAPRNREETGVKASMQHFVDDSLMATTLSGRYDAGASLE